jgi:hypothetical protein
LRASTLKAGYRTDFVAVPGGIEPLTLADLMPKDFNFFRRRLEGLMRRTAPGGSSRSRIRIARGTSRAARANDARHTRTTDC